MEPLLPLMLPMGIWDPFIAVGSAIMQPLYWVVSGILVLFHSLWSPVFGADSGANRDGVRTDVAALLSVDAKTGKSLLI